MVQNWRAEAASKGRPLKLPRMPFMLRNIWTAAMLLFTALTFSTFFISTLAQAIVVVSLIGICWAVACWVPFAIIMEVRSITFGSITGFMVNRLCSSSSRNLVKSLKRSLCMLRRSAHRVAAMLVITSAIFPRLRSIAGVGMMNVHLCYVDVPSVHRVKTTKHMKHSQLREGQCWVSITWQL